MPQRFHHDDDHAWAAYDLRAQENRDDGAATAMPDPAAARAPELSEREKLARQALGWGAYMQARGHSDLTALLERIALQLRRDDAAREA